MFALTNTVTAKGAVELYRQMHILQTLQTLTLRYLQAMERRTKKKKKESELVFGIRFAKATKI